MSWSAYYTGSPEAVCAALDKHLASFGQSSPNQSRDEFAAALPHLKGLVAQNMRDSEKCAGEGWPSAQPIVKLEAWGSGSTINGVLASQSCSCKIEVVAPNC